MKLPIWFEFIILGLILFLTVSIIIKCFRLLKPTKLESSIYRCMSIYNPDIKDLILIFDNYDTYVVQETIRVLKTSDAILKSEVVDA